MSQANTASSSLQPVQDFWNTKACGTHFVKDEKEFYEKYRAFRYQVE